MIFKDVVLISIYFDPNEIDGSVRDMKPDLLLSKQNVIDMDKKMVISYDSNTRSV